MTLRMKIAVGFAAIHLVLVVLCFSAAILRSETSSLAPVFVLFADIPASLAIEPIRHALDGLSSSYTSRLLLDGFSYAVLGTIWWFVVGAAAGWIFMKWRESLRDGTTI
jgi:hypothetical protein